MINKIKKADCDTAIEKFLLEMLYFELEHVEEAYPRYSKYYDTYIDAFAKQFEMKNNEV